jgi:hypothetical protein
MIDLPLKSHFNTSFPGCAGDLGLGIDCEGEIESTRLRTVPCKGTALIEFAMNRPHGATPLVWMVQSSVRSIRASGIKRFQVKRQVISVLTGF